MTTSHPLSMVCRLGALVMAGGSLLLAPGGAFGQARTGAPALRVPDRSPRQTVIQEVGLARIEITYNRPSLRGRRMIGAELPYDSLWRMGANSATRMQTSAPITVGGTALDTGTYALYAIPRPGDWTVVINRGTGNWGTAGYQMSQDVARVPARRLPRNGAGTVQETFTISFEEMARPGVSMMVFSWDTIRVGVEVVHEYRPELRAALERALIPGAPTPKPFDQAATFFYLHDRDLPRALETTDSAIAGQLRRGRNPYWLYLQRARILNENGQSAPARTAALEAQRLARIERNQDYDRMVNEFLATLPPAAAEPARGRQGRKR